MKTTREPVRAVPVVESVAVTVNEVDGITGVLAVVEMIPVPEAIDSPVGSDPPAVGAIE
jgi:hypothetical protein